MEGSTALPTPGGKLRKGFTSQIQEGGVDPMWVCSGPHYPVSLICLNQNSQGTWKARESGQAPRKQHHLSPFSHAVPRVGQET